MNPSGSDDDGNGGGSANQAPNPSISSPSDSASYLEGDTVTFEGSASDPEDGDLSGSSLVWKSDLDDRLGTGKTLEVSDLSVGEHTVTLTATDSEGAKDSDEVAVAVEEPENKAPSAQIESPANDTTLTEGDTVVFEGSASDPEDGPLSGASLVWKSDLDDRLGTGKTLEVSDLSVGEHTVTLTATDSEGAKDSDEVAVAVEEPVFTPTVDLSVKLPRPDLPFADSAIIANGEQVLLTWNTTNEPSFCEASGGWSGEKSTSGDTIATAGLSGPASPEYILRCENSAGADADTVHVDVGAPGDRHATSNRPDDNSQKVRFFYVIPEGGEDRELDLNGGIENTFKAFQDSFEVHTDRRFKVDSYGNGYDITFLTVDTTTYVEDEQQLNDLIRQELKDRGLYNREKYFLVIFYDGYTVGLHSSGWGREAFIYNLLDDPQRPKDPTTIGHELVHSHALVDKDAPHEGDNHHVMDHENDLMDNTSGKPFSDHFLVDYGCDDYYWDPNLPRCADVPEPADDIRLLSDSPVLFTPN